MQDEHYFTTVNFVNMMFDPKLKKASTPAELFKHKKEDDAGLKDSTTNLPSQTAISIKFRFNFFEMDYSKFILTFQRFSRG